MTVQPVEPTKVNLAELRVDKRTETKRAERHAEIQAQDELATSKRTDARAANAERGQKLDTRA